jgi:hypothetical protein
MLRRSCRALPSVPLALGRTRAGPPAASAVLSTRALQTKIDVANPVVELDGDEMTRIIWQRIKDEVWPVLMFLGQLTSAKAYPAFS